MPEPHSSLSTLHREQLPAITTLRRICQSIAMLDAILSPEWSARYYSFNSRWAPGQAMASMRDGSGDAYHVLFTPAGAILKGYAHESRMARYCVEHGHPWPGVLEGVPDEFAGFLAEPAFSSNETTFCLWRRWTDTGWHIGSFDILDAPEDGSEDLLVMLDGNPATYKAWAEEYYDDPGDDEGDDEDAEPLSDGLPLEAIAQVYAHAPLTEEVVHALNPMVERADLAEDSEEIGYPSPLP